MKKTPWASGTGVVLLLLVLAGYVFYPLSMTVQESLRDGDEWSLGQFLRLVDPSNLASREAIFNSLWISLASVVLGGLGGTFLAFVFTQIEFPFRNILAKLAIVPIALPPLVGVIAFLFVFGEGGILPRSLQLLFGTEAVPFYLDGLPAILLVHAYSFNVYFLLFVSNALKELDGSQLEAAESLGSGAWRQFFRVALPAIRPALFGASMLTFMSSMASFSAPFLFGGGERFLTTEIYTSKLNGDMGTASAQAIALTLISVLAFAFLKLSGDGADRPHRRRGTVRVRAMKIPPMARTVLLVFAVIILILEALPIITILLISFAREGSWTWQILPQEYTAGNYLKLFMGTRAFEPVLNSIMMSLAALGASLLVGIPIAYVITKGVSKKVGFWFDLVASMPYAIPGTVVALSLILAFNSPVLMSGFTILVGTFWILPLAYFVRTFPLLVRSTSASLQQLDTSLIEAGQSFGAGWGRRFRKIVFPQVLPGVVSGSVLILIAGLGEFVSSILLYTHQNRPISIEILSNLRGYDFGGAAAISVILLGLILLVTWVAGGVVRGRRIN